MRKTKLGWLEKNLFLTFFQIDFFLVFFKFLNAVCPDWIQKSQSSYKKNLQSLNEATKKSLK